MISELGCPNAIHFVVDEEECTACGGSGIGPTGDTASSCPSCPRRQVVHVSALTFGRLQVSRDRDCTGKHDVWDLAPGVDIIDVLQCLAEWDGHGDVPLPWMRAFSADRPRVVRRARTDPATGTVIERLEVDGKIIETPTIVVPR